MDKQPLPPGWSEDRIRRVISHYEGQTEEEAILEDELESGDPSPEAARKWLVEFAVTPEGQGLAIAARAIKQLSENDLLILYRETRSLLEESRRAG